MTALDTLKTLTGRLFGRNPSPAPPAAPPEPTVAPTPAAEHVHWLDAVAPYVPGQLYLRELPCLLAVLERVARPLDAVLVDGYAVLDAQGRPGLGAHLHGVERRIPVVGVAKTHFRGSTAVEVLRGGSTRPLYVTAVGIDPERAAMPCGQGAGAIHDVLSCREIVEKTMREAETTLRQLGGLVG